MYHCLTFHENIRTHSCKHDLNQQFTSTTFSRLKFLVFFFELIYKFHFGSSKTRPYGMSFLIVEGRTDAYNCFYPLPFNFGGNLSHLHLYHISLFIYYDFIPNHRELRPL